MVESRFEPFDLYYMDAFRALDISTGRLYAKPAHGRNGQSPPYFRSY